jgi:hypothetical protein
MGAPVVGRATRFPASKWAFSPPEAGILLSDLQGGKIAAPASDHWPETK